MEIIINKEDTTPIYRQIFGFCADGKDDGGNDSQPDIFKGEMSVPYDTQGNVLNYSKSLYYGSKNKNGDNNSDSDCGFERNARPRDASYQERSQRQ